MLQTAMHFVRLYVTDGEKVFKNIKRQTKQFRGNSCGLHKPDLYGKVI